MNSKKTTQTLAEAFKELEQITLALESEKLNLETAVPQFKRAVGLAKLIKQQLNQIETELETINLDDVVSRKTPH